MTKIILEIMVVALAIALIISIDNSLIIAIILCWGFIGMIEAIEKIGQRK